MAGANRLAGSGGNDVLSGGSGRDKLLGGSGADRLDGGADADRLTGKQRRRYLRFQGVAGIAGDVITDFTQGEDLIDLSAIDAVAGGSDSPFHVGSGAGGLAFRQSATQTFGDGDLNGDGTADFTLTLTGLKVLTPPTSSSEVQRGLRPSTRRVSSVLSALAMALAVPPSTALTCASKSA